ncbi:MAG: acyltransferase family protein [Bacteroidales bacterium]|nr:acyltransferase family protein [Bacteroidales bacterium]
MMSFDKDKLILVKALMALLIVADHLNFFLDLGWLRPARELGAPIVSMFFFISGFGLVRSYQGKGPAYLKSFLGKKFLRIVLPALLALACYYLLLWNPGRDYPGDWKNLVLYGTPILPFSWFAEAIVFFYLIYYLSFRFLPGKWKAAGLLAGTLAWMAATILAGYDWCWWICSLSFPAGALFAWKEKEIYAFCEERPYRYYALLGVLSIVFLVLYLPRNPYLWTLCYILIPTIVALLVARLPIGRLHGPVITFICGISYEIYLCHGIPMELFRDRLPIDSGLLFIIAVYALTVLLAFAVHKASTFISSKICA